MAEQETYYEMLWDCPQCATRGLLGDSHRHCPACGTAQDPAKRYFPKPGEEIEASQHKFVGVDWRCAYCASPNSAAAAFCANCGAGKDGTRPVALIADAPATPPPAPAAAPAARGLAWFRWALGLLVLAVLALVMMFSSTKETAVTVAQRSWQREVQIEKLSSVADSAWCDSMPADAYGVTRTREERSSRKIPDGQDCHDVRVDQGDGRFVKRAECVPRYRQEPVYDNRCHFQVNRWRSSRSVKAGTANGVHTAMAPMWPSVGLLNAGLPGAASLRGNAAIPGMEREGARSENYVLTLSAQGKTWTCSVPEAVWRKYTEGTATPVKLRMIGGVDCASLK